MKLNITVFKPTGKYYTDDVAELPGKNPVLHTKEFLDFVRDNLPARLTGGFVLVQNANPNSNSFYTHLYRYDDLMSM